MIMMKSPKIEYTFFPNTDSVFNGKISSSADTILPSLSYSKAQEVSNTILVNPVIIKSGTNTILEKYDSFTSMAERVAQWFLNKASMSNKKLQKLCYYAYCWHIVFFNDLENIKDNCETIISVLFDEKFQAWIHGPVLPTLYNKFKRYGWLDIPQESTCPVFPSELEMLLQRVMEAYGSFSADDLERLSHTEEPWIKARKDIPMGAVCTNEISPNDILAYFSRLGE